MMFFSNRCGKPNKLSMLPAVFGNRSSTRAGGDEKGLNLRSAAYSVNDLNQYTNRTVPGGVDIVGVANAPAVVTVNNQAAYRHTEYYRKELSITNTAAPQYVGATNKAGQSGTTNTVTGNVFLPKTPEVFAYDADGNLLSDGRWTNSWDAENRLISMQGLSTLPTATRQQLDFEYDWMSRRIRKTVSNWSVNKFVPAFTNRFVYDGWNLLVEANASNLTQRKYIWGLDLSGSEQGAGGVGGLLAMQDVAGNNGVQFAAYDLNGNIAALVRATNGTISATYEYGPFGELIRANGALARTNAFRFSTKYQDDESDLLYYGYRYLSTSTGRWLSRDPSAEGGGLNLYAALGNDATDYIDALGLSIECCGAQKFFEEKGIGPNLYDKSGNVYSAKAGATFNGLNSSEIVWKMLVAKTVFKAKNLKVSELRRHVEARLTIANNAAASLFCWRDARIKQDILNPTGPYRAEILQNPNAFFLKNPDAFIAAINNSGTQLRCENATRYIFESGNRNEGTGIRLNDSVFIPGDWPYLDNVAQTQNPSDWASGFEGENLIVVWGRVFWGHPTGTQTDYDWRQTIMGWLSRTGKPGIPQWGSHTDIGPAVIRYPGIGLELPSHNSD